MQSDRDGVGNGFDEREFFSTLGVHKDFGNHLHGYFSQKYNWFYDENYTEAAVSKVYTTGNKLFRTLGISNAADDEDMDGPVIVSLNGDYDWETNDYRVYLNLRADF